MTSSLQAVQEDDDEDDFVSLGFPPLGGIAQTSAKQKSGQSSPLFYTSKLSASILRVFIVSSSPRRRERVDLGRVCASVSQGHLRATVGARKVPKATRTPPQRQDAT